MEIVCPTGFKIKREGESVPEYVMRFRSFGYPNVTKCTLHKTLKSMTWCKLTFDEMVVVHRVVRVEVENTRTRHEPQPQPPLGAALRPVFRFRVSRISCFLFHF